MVLVAACSTAILSSLYTARARGTVALSVTAVSSVGSVATLPPILLLGLGRVAGGEARVSVPVGHRMGQLFVLLLVPAILGMIDPEAASRTAASTCGSASRSCALSICAARRPKGCSSRMLTAGVLPAA